jgi:hypothetical protein
VGIPKEQKAPQGDPKFFPGCIFLAKNRPHESIIVKTFREDGFRVEYVDSLQKLKERLEDRSNFLVFIEAPSFPEAFTWLTQLGPFEERKFFWIAMANCTKPAQAALFFKAGASDVLTPPVHPHLARGRAQLMIKRYLSVLDFPKEIILPPGIDVPNRENYGHVSYEENPEPIMWIKDDPKDQPTKVKILEQGIPYPERFTAPQLKAIEEAQKVFKRRGSWFEEVQEEGLKSAIVTLASIQQSAITLWSRKPKLRFDTTAIHFYPEERTFYLDGIGSDDFVKKTNGKDIFCHLRLGLASIFFLGKLATAKSSLQLMFPVSMYEVQRRGSLRMPFSESDLAIAELNPGKSNVAVGRILDISSTGVKLQFPTNTLDSLELFSTQVLSFEFFDLKIVCECQLRWKTIRDGQSFGGFLFHNLSDRLREEVAFKILEHFGPNFEVVFRGDAETAAKKKTE